MKPSRGLGIAAVLIASLVILLVPSLKAQTSGTGALTGTVTDPTGAVIPNVTVTVTSVATGQARTTTSGPDGTYKVGLLPPGNYRVKFDVANFKSVEVPSVTVTVTETGTLNQSLEIGAQTTQVTVEANVETVQTSSSTLGTVIGTQTVTDLPLSTRNYTNLLGLSAGASANVTNASQLGKGTEDIAVNGSSESSNNFQMDGATIVNFQSGDCCVENGSHAAFGIPNPDAIQEFKIQTSLYDAGYGQNPGANVNVVTKSGSNDFHGTAFEFFRNTVLNANDWFHKHSEIAGGQANSRGPLNQNQFGGVFGGPVKKDKLFFFVSYQETQQKNGLFSGSSNFFLPSLPSGDRSNSATFATALQAIYCGQKGSAVGATGGIAIGGPCGPGSPINPIAIQLLQLKNPNGSYYIPTPNLGNTAPGISCAPLNGLLASCNSVDPATYKEHQAVGNWDYVINEKNTLSGRYFVSMDPAFQPFLGTPTALPGAATSTQYTNHAAVLKLTTVLSNNLVNEARISFQRNISFTTPAFAFTNNNLAPASSTNVQIAPVTPGIDTLDTIINGPFQMGAAPFSATTDVTNQFQLADQISWTHGKHTLRAGFEAQSYWWAWNFPGLSTGFMAITNFTDLLQGLPACTGTNGNPLPFSAACTASALAGTTNGSFLFSNIFGTLNVVTRYAPPSGSDFHFRTNDYDSFVQDDFKINNRLTLNLGLRWEYDFLVHEINGKNTNIYPSLISNVPPLVSNPCPTPAVAFPAPAPTGCGTYAGYVAPSNFHVPFPAGVYQSNHTAAPLSSQPWDNFAPRIGFAWQPLSTSRFVVRGGFGYFYDRLPGEDTIHAVLQSAPYANTVGVGFGAANGFASLAQPFFPGAANWLPRWVTASGASSNIGEQAVAQNFPTPLVYEYNLNMQYEFAPSWVLELGYVGSHGIHQFDGTLPINGAGLGAAAVTSAAPTTSNVDLRVPYLGMLPSWALEATTGAEKYNSFQATVRKQMSHGLLIQAAYTWSRAFATYDIGNVKATSAGIAPVVTVYGPNQGGSTANTGGSGYHPNRLAINYSWNLPLGHAQGLEGKLLEGWALSGTTTIQDGTPLTITDGSGGAIYGAPVTSNAQFATGMGPANVATSGSMFQRVLNGLTNPASGGYLNPHAFSPSTATGSTFPVIDGGSAWGNSGLGILLGPGQNNWDMSLEKTTKVGGLRENATLQFRAEFFNAFNHPQFSNPSTFDVTSGTFGVISSASVSPRLVQFALKYAF